MLPSQLSKAILSLLLVCLTLLGSAAVHTVTNTADAGAGSLRQAILNASVGDSITFSPQLFGDTIFLASEILIDKDLVIMSPSADSICISGDGVTRIFDIASGDQQFIGLKLIRGLTPTSGSLFNKSGGAIRNQQGDLKVIRCVLYLNRATFGSGAGIYSTSGSLEVRHSTLTRNVGQNGSGINNAQGNIAIIDSCLIDSNWALVSGGGLYNQGISCLVTATTFTGNLARLGGGVNNNTSLSLTACSFQGNYTSGVPSLPPGGGGLYANGGSTTIADASFTDNESERGGGAHFTLSASWSICSSNFVGNQAEYGAGIWTSVSNGLLQDCEFNTNAAIENGGGVQNEGLVDVRNCVFRMNSADDGAGISNEGASLFLTDCLLEGNNAISGGGLYNRFGGVLVDRCTFTGNSTLSLFGGGAILSSGNFSVIQVNRSTIVGNTGFNGGGIYNQAGSTLTIRYSTITGNSAVSTAGGVFANNATVNYLSTILAGNLAATGPDGSRSTTGSHISLGYNLIGDTSTMGLSATSGDLLGNALAPIDALLDTLGDNGGLTPTVAISCVSPAFNAGDPADTSSDQRNLALLSVRDIGSFEVQQDTCGVSCETPTALASSAGITAAALSWQGGDGAISYTLRGTQVGLDSNSFVELTVSDTSLTATGLQPATSYYWQVRANCTPSSASSYSAIDTFTTQSASNACPAPLSLVVSNIGSTTAALNWNATPNAVAYVVRGSEGVFDKTQLVFLTVSSNSVQVSGLKPGTAYFWQVQSVCNNTPGPVSAFSALDSFMTLVGPAPKTGISGSLNIYPNPADDYMTIDVPYPLDLDIYDLMGRRIESHVLKASQTKVAVRHLSAGVYKMVFTGLGYREVHSIVISRP